MPVALPSPLQCTTVLEFYSGIGGMHFALRGQILAAFDINTTANSIYKHNFPATSLRQNNIQAISVKELDRLNADLWTMSPPCQPYAKKGLGLGEADARSDSFIALLSKLSEMSSPPRLFFLENVVGFEESSSHSKLVAVLISLGCSIQQFILCPTQFGVPNQRPRFYLLARRDGEARLSTISKIPPELNSSLESSPILHILESCPSEELIVSLKELERHGAGMDIISESSTRSSCFTKSYGAFAVGCGSYVCDTPSLIQDDRARLRDPRSAYPHVRRFSVREMARLMSFPEDFSLPGTISRRQAYKCLGNSVNVRVVASLLELLLTHPHLQVQ